ncbi:MAG TPA: hypothetical protein VFK57_09985 [Vicinamibacterales bacterium]|nr:hypothetical protein [Vicinamibacterales bacterium]
MAGIERMREHLETHSWPRLNCVLMVALSAGAAFLSSVLLLSIGVESMALRDGAAALAGYFTFVSLIRGWVAWKRRQFTSDSDLDVGDVLSNLDLPLPRSRHGRGVCASAGRAGGAIDRRRVGEGGAVNRERSARRAGCRQLPIRARTRAGFVNVCPATSTLTV